MHTSLIYVCIYMNFYSFFFLLLSFLSILYKMTFEFEERQGSLIDSVMPTDSIVLGMTEDMKLLNKGNHNPFNQIIVNIKKIYAQG